jgi:hypothetical protein
MITLKELKEEIDDIITLKELKEEIDDLIAHGHGDKKVFYAIDNEGNHFQPIINLPCTMKVPGHKEYVVVIN